MNSLIFSNLVLFGTIFLLLHFGVEAESSSTCSVPGLPGRDGLSGQPGRDGRDGSSGPAGPPGAPGANGPVGVVGPPGEQGPPGLTGPPGSNACDASATCSPGAPGAPGPPGTPATSGGTAYIRWGRTVCPNVTGTELVYAGLTAGSHFTHNGGGANYICTAAGDDVEYHPESTTVNAGEAILFGTEYEIPTGQQALADLNEHNAPCAVCDVSSRSRKIMIPGRYTCPDTWTVEYSGWLMAEGNKYVDHHRTMHICLDKTPETVVGLEASINAALMFHVEADCGTGLPCPNYDDTKELACVVCTK